MNAIVFDELRLVIELRSGYRVLAMRERTRIIWVTEMAALKKNGDSSKTTAGAIAGATELTEAVLLATIEKRM
jgi:hypothetical protein